MQVFRRLATDAEVFVRYHTEPPYAFMVFPRSFKHDLYIHRLELTRSVTEPVPQHPSTIALLLKDGRGTARCFAFFTENGIFPENFSEHATNHLKYQKFFVATPLQEDRTSAVGFLLKAMASLDCCSQTDPTVAEVLKKVEVIRKIKYPAWDSPPSKEEIIRMLHVQLRLSSGLVPVVTGSLSLPLLKFSSDMLLLHLMVLRYREGIFVREADTETSSAAMSTTTSSCKRSATIKRPAAQSSKRARRPKPCSSAPTEEPEGETPLEPSAMIEGQHRPDSSSSSSSSCDREFGLPFGRSAEVG